MKSFNKLANLTHFTKSYLYMHHKSRTFSHKTHEPSNPDFENRVKEVFGRAGLMQHLQMKVATIKPGFVEVHLPFHQGVSQQHGFFHGGVISTMADTSAGCASYTLIPKTSTILSVEFKVNLLSPAAGELLIAQGTVIKPGKTLHVVKSDVFVEKQGQRKLCATALLTMMPIDSTLKERDHGHNK